MTPKQMARLGVFQIQEAILSVLEQEPEGLALETIGTALGISDYPSKETLFTHHPIVIGVLAKLKSEGYVEISDEYWKIVRSTDNDSWTIEKFKKLISEQKDEGTYSSKGQIERLSELGVDLMNLVDKEQWKLSYKFRQSYFAFYCRGQPIFGINLQNRRPRLCIWLPEHICIDREQDWEIDPKHEKYYEWVRSIGFAAYPTDVGVAALEPLLEFTYLYRTDQLDQGK